MEASASRELLRLHEYYFCCHRFTKMNFKYLVALCLIFVLVVPDADSWLWGRRRRRRRVPVPGPKPCRRHMCWRHCGVRCRYRFGKLKCTPYCRRLCGWKTVPCGKRDEPEQDDASFDEPKDNEPQIQNGPETEYQDMPMV